ncbi:MAG: hypothetical protein H0T14_00160 [Nocardioidaceae bacterium]|nr:hypothetical protein [Nocardioidaceae bacterium]
MPDHVIRRALPAESDSLAELLWRVRQQNLGSIPALVHPGARRFYERLGFVAVQWTDGDNEERALDVRYEWTRPSLLKPTPRVPRECRCA